MKNFSINVICLIAIFLVGCEPPEPAISNKVVTGEVADVTHSSALFHGRVHVDISTYNNVEFGIMMAETKEELNAHEGEMYKADVLMGSDFKLELDCFLPATSYYYCAWLLLNDTQYEFGDIKQFQTLGATEPVVITFEATQLGLRSATVGGNVTDNGGYDVVEYGICYSISTNPSISDKKIVCGSGLGEFTCDLIDLEKGTRYHVRAYATNNIGTSYGDEIEFTTLDKIEIAAIDLGLSVKWANMNIGAERPEDYGDYFAWGETQPKETYNWSTYKWCNGSYDSLTKYNNSSSYGAVDNKTVLEASDDAAAANWGASWRMPTDAELAELRNNCTWTWTSQNGLTGYKVTSTKNSNSIFLPAAGCRIGSDLIGEGYMGTYWLSSLRSSPSYDCDCAEYMYLFKSAVPTDAVMFNNRAFGFSVRPVCQ